jgi:hypothetical protein
MSEKKRDRMVGLDEKRRLGGSQARFIAKETSLAIDEVAELKVGDVGDKLATFLDPYWLFNRKLCGRVVQRDPLTGELRGVPGATVEVRDTDCSGWFRKVGTFHWFYPLGCTQDTIATAVTDECGYFCVWIPRWLSEWVLRWRKERICFPVERPRIGDVIPIPLPDPPVVRDPGWIDPVPQTVVQSDPRLDHVTAKRVDTLTAEISAGSGRAGLDRLLAEPLRLAPPAPPSDEDLVGYTPHPDEPVDLENPFGPYEICRDVYVPDWELVTDVPDITFHVTQTIGGSDVVIYSEGYFEVRWDDTGGGEVTLEANAFAVSTDVCAGAGIVCQGAAGIISADDMPLDQGASPLFHNDATGYGVRVNRPSTNGLDAPSGVGVVADGEAPIADTLDLLGCVHDVSGAQFYRVLFDKGLGPEPITGTSWPALSPSGIVTVGPDASGYVEILPLLGHFEHLLMKWPTVKYPNTSYDVWVEVYDGSKTKLETSPGHTFVIDNSQPTFLLFDVAYRVGGTGPFAPLDVTDCPKIFREPAKLTGGGTIAQPGEEVEIRVVWRATAAHLRNAWVAMGGCGGGSPAVSGDARWYWQTSGATDTGLHTVTFSIPATADAGCYTLTREAVSRAYNPATPGFSPANDYWENDRRRWDRGSWSISVVDE